MGVVRELLKNMGVVGEFLKKLVVLVDVIWEAFWHLVRSRVLVGWPSKEEDKFLSKEETSYTVRVLRQKN